MTKQTRRTVEQEVLSVVVRTLTTRSTWPKQVAATGEVDAEHDDSRTLYALHGTYAGTQVVNDFPTS